MLIDHNNIGNIVLNGHIIILKYYVERSIAYPTKHVYMRAPSIQDYSGSLSPHV